MADTEQKNREALVGSSSAAGPGAAGRNTAAQGEKIGPAEYNFTPELHLIDGRIIRNIDDAILFLREHEVRPGVDRRDEVMHLLERAKTREEVHAGALHFITWLEELGILE